MMIHLGTQGWARREQHATLIWSKYFFFLDVVKILLIPPAHHLLPHNSA
jgi:hypothetical protein